MLLFDFYLLVFVVLMVGVIPTFIFDRSKKPVWDITLWNFTIIENAMMLHWFLKHGTIFTAEHLSCLIGWSLILWMYRHHDGEITVPKKIYDLHQVLFDSKINGIGWLAYHLSVIAAICAIGSAVVCAIGVLLFQLGFAYV